MFEYVKNTLAFFRKHEGRLPHQKLGLTIMTSCFRVVPFFLAVFLAILPATKAEAGFIYAPINEPIISASFNADFAALVAHRYVAGEQVNMLQLMGLNGDILDLSDAFFGTSELLNGDIPLINQGPLETHIFSAAIPSSFFPSLGTGRVGLSFTVTDTDDGLFAMDFLSLEITTATGVVTSFIDSNDGYKIGLPDNASLSDPLPISIQIGATGTGFDEAISSKSIHNTVPEPATLALVLLGLVGVVLAHRHRPTAGSTCNKRRKIGWLLAAITLGGIGSAQAADVVVNEVLYYEDPSSPDPIRTHEWVEIYNKSSTSVDLSGWVISGRDGKLGSSARTLPAGVVLPPGAYLVVHYAPGVNDLDFSDGCGDYYTGDPTGISYFDNGMDEVALYSPSNIVDFLSWNDGDTGYQPGVAHSDAVVATIWTAGSFINSDHIALNSTDKFDAVEPGTSIGRDKDSTDTDQPKDWGATGGWDALDLTPCRRNFTFAPLVPVDGGAAPAQKEWTVMVYMSADNDLEEDAFNDLKEMERSGGSDGNVNIVVMVDGFNKYTQCFVDATNNLVCDPTKAGGTFRFSVGPEVDNRFVPMVSHAGNIPYLGEVDMGDPDVLTKFIAWAKATYPAKKYALVLWGHGKGWKNYGPDFHSIGPVTKDYDRLYMGELMTALAGNRFELLGFDACLMGQVEVAYQVEPFSNYYIASQEVEKGDGWPYDQLLAGLKANPNWNGAQLGSRIVADYHNYYSGLDRRGRVRDPKHTLSLIDQSKLPPLVVNTISPFAGDLRMGSDDFKTHDTPTDNVEHLIAVDRNNTEQFRDKNFMDLRRFSELINGDAGIPGCYKAQAANVVAQMNRGGPVVLAEAHGPAHPNANGLTIYMPRNRTAPDDPRDDPYDNPRQSRATNENSQRAMYAANNDALPLHARDVENDRLPLAAPREWPLIPTPNFRFPANTLWDEFLMRFYHPVADNHILRAQGPKGEKIEAVINDPVCGNPIDEITIFPGWTVVFTGMGSSDADTGSQRPLHWMWDFDSLTKGCTTCLAPYEVAKNTDAAEKANDDMNADHDANKTPLNDEKEADQEDNVSHTFTAVRDYTVTLNVWDDNHKFPFHDTNPDATYVHPQTDDHTSIVHVVPLPDQLHVVGPVPNKVAVGATSSVTATAQANNIGVKGVEVVFTKILGDFNFLSGNVSPDGSQAKLNSDANGVALMSFKANSVGRSLIKVTITGTSLAAYSFFTIVP